MPTLLNKHAQRCTATSKRSGERCQNPSVKGWQVCRIHGAGGGRPIEVLISDDLVNIDGRLVRRILKRALSRQDKYVIGSEKWDHGTKDTTEITGDEFDDKAIQMELEELKAALEELEKRGISNEATSRCNVSQNPCGNYVLSF